MFYLTLPAYQTSQLNLCISTYLTCSHMVSAKGHLNKCFKLDDKSSVEICLFQLPVVSFHYCISHMEVVS